MGKIIINSAFWYLGRKYGGQLRLCSHRKVDNTPKYQIVPSIDGGAVLDILSDDFNEDKKILTFQPTGERDAMSEAMHFAERYEVVYSMS